MVCISNVQISLSYECPWSSAKVKLLFVKVLSHLAKPLVSVPSGPSGMRADQIGCPGVTRSPVCSAAGRLI